MKLAEDSVSAIEAQAACRDILASEKFARAPRMCRLLQFLVDNAISGNSNNTSEHAIGVAVLDRDEQTYCTIEDPSVRVQVGRLREKLKSYHAAVAPDIEISIPPRSYTPVFRRLGYVNTGGANCQISFRQIKCISECGNGESLALGLQEEILHQLFKIFDGVKLIHQRSGVSNAEDISHARRISDNGAGLVLEASVRVDEQRIRISTHLLDAKYGNVKWSEQFDSHNSFDISLQEELAFTICDYLKQFMIKNRLY